MLSFVQNKTFIWNNLRIKKPAVVAEWSKPQVFYCLIMTDPKFESHLGHVYTEKFISKINNSSPAIIVVMLYTCLAVCLNDHLRVETILGFSQLRHNSLNDTFIFQSNL